MRSQKFIFLFSFFVFLFIGGLFVFPNDVNANTTAHYTVTGGTDASGGTAVRFTTSDVQKLNISDSEPGNGVDRMRSEKWPDQNQYDENRYIEFIFSPEISENAIISEVKILHEFQRSGALAGVKIEVWDGESFVNIEGSTSGIIGEDHTDVISATAVLNTAQKINNTKIRFLVYRATVTQSGTTTGHDFIGLSVTYALLSPPEQPAEEEDSAEPKESSNSPTYITEDIIENTAWTLAGSPYVIEKNIHVTAGNTLTIEPGVIVKFSPYMSISIYGSLSAEGTSDNNIYFTSLWDDSIGGDTNEDGNATIPNSYSKRGYWRGIHYFSAEGEQSLKNILLSRAQLGLFFNDSDVVIEGLEAISNIIDVSAYNNSSVNVSKLKSKNSFGSVFNDNANLTLDDSIIDNGLSNIYAGVNLSNGGYTTIKGTRISHYSKAGIYDKGGSIVNISNTEISNNFSYGIFVGNNANFSNSQYVVDGLTIKGNTQYSAYNQATSYDIDLRNVYWGTSSGTRLSKGPKDLGNVVSKRILFSPWLLTDPLLSSSEKVITSFSFKNLTPNVDGIINEADHSIILTVPFGTDVKNLIPTVTVSLGASVDPGSNETQDFSSPLIYTVAAEDGSTQEYTVTVVPSCTENCFSNILFIPGFQGSRLYKQKHILLVGDVEDKLWEPNSNSDVADMYMDENGASINRLIYTRDIIEEKKASFFSGGDIYKSFMDDMQAMVADNIISEWRSAPYDWRLSPSQVVERGIIENGTLSYNEDLDTGETSFILKQLEQLAETSKDGKVTIVTHSNGGLVAKALIKKLMEMKASDQGDLIDSVDRLIMVAAPQIGTPKAVAALLHGYGQEIGFGFFLKQKIARKFGINLPGAYSLLPSANYFTRLKGYPVISFDKSIDPLSLNLRGLYGGKIDSFSEFNSFLLDKENNRPNPADNDVLNPAKLNEKILDGAKTLHTDIDADIFPDTMKVYQVAGWGLSTVKNITYYNQRECISSIENKPCTPKNSLSEYVNFTVDGDETVASPSATYVTNSDTENYYLNFDQYIKDTENKKIRHNNIFEMPYLRTLIRNILTDISTIPSYITKEKPKDSKNLIITVPKKIVKIAVKSKIDNKKTGDRPKIQNPDPSNPSNYDFDKVDEEIPGSSYTVFGGRGYIVLPGGGAGYTVSISGVSSSDSSSDEEDVDTESDSESESDFEAISGSGFITIRQDVVVDDQVISTVFYPNIPVTPTTQAEFTVEETGTAGDLIVDQEGDGTFETTILPVVVPNTDPELNPDGPVAIPEEFQAPAAVIADPALNSDSAAPVVSIPEEIQPPVLQDNEVIQDSPTSPNSSGTSSNSSSSSSASGGGRVYSMAVASSNIVASSALNSDSSSSAISQPLNSSGEQAAPLAVASVESAPDAENIIVKSDLPIKQKTNRSENVISKIDAIEKTEDNLLAAAAGSTEKSPKASVVIVSLAGALGLALVARYVVR